MILTDISAAAAAGMAGVGNAFPVDVVAVDALIFFSPARLVESNDRLC